jgi:hypothetical protein
MKSQFGSSRTQIHTHIPSRFPEIRTCIATSLSTAQSRAPVTTLSCLGAFNYRRSIKASSVSHLGSTSQRSSQLLLLLTISSYEFMHRTELCFRSLHERIIRLEDRQAWQKPSDEQLERVLRKILAERFADGERQPVQDVTITKEEEYFVEDRRRCAVLSPIAIDPSSLFVEPDAVPSKAYSETFNMLENHMAGYPNINMKNTVVEDSRDQKRSYGFMESRSLDAV